MIDVEVLITLLLFSNTSLFSFFCSLITLLGTFRGFTILLHILLLIFLWNVGIWPLREIVHAMVFLVSLSLVDYLFVLFHLDPILVDELLKLIILFAKFMLVFVLNASLMCKLCLEIASCLLLILVCILQLLVQFVHCVLC